MRQIDNPAIGGTQFLCPICSGNQFFVRRASFSSRAAELFGFAFAGPKTAVLICRHCGRLEWFVGPEAKRLLRQGVSANR